MEGKNGTAAFGTAVQVYALNLAGVGDCEDLMACLAEDTKRRVRSFRSPERARQTMFGELIVRAVACRELALANDELIFVRDSYGKPALANSGDFHFSISHAGDWVVCAFDSMEVGVDVERVEEIDVLGIGSLFAAEEYDLIMRQDPGARLNKFYELWTLKESCMKLLGQGMSGALDSVRIAGPVGEIYQAIHSGNKNIYAWQLELASGYKVSVSSVANRFPAQIEVITDQWVRALLSD